MNDFYEKSTEDYPWGNTYGWPISSDEFEALDYFIHGVRLIESKDTLANVPDKIIIKTHVSEIKFASENLSSNRYFDIKLPDYDLPELRRFEIYGSSFTGELSISNYPKLEYLNARGCFNLEGEFPKVDFPNLKYLDISNTKISGEFPKINLENVEYFNISDSDISGTFPDIKMPKLKSLFFYQTNIHGELPDIFNDEFRQLGAYRCNLYGEIPNSLLRDSVTMTIFSNKYTFKSLENATNKIDEDNLKSVNINYSVQDTILPITQAGNQLEVIVDGEFNLYQWYKDTTKITGATEKTFAPAQDGNYKCVVNNSKLTNLTLESELYNYTTTSVEENSVNFSIYPNPTAGDLYIQLEGKSIATRPIIIRDINGSAVLEKQITGSNKLNLESLTAGMYFIEIDGQIKKIIAE